MGKGVYDRLRARYPEREYALMCEVRDGAGFNANRSADYSVEFIEVDEKFLTKD